MWAQALDLFDRLLDADDPSEAFDEHTDPEIRLLAEHLMIEHNAAEAEGFLRDSPAAVKGLWKPDAPTFPNGTLLVNDRFRIIQLLGTGGMGEVYRAHDNTLEEDVALKTIRRNLASDPEVRRQFKSEIKSARQVHHRGICRIHDVFDFPETPLFFSMEYLAGERLLDKLKDSAFAAADRKRTALQLAEGLLELHNRGFIHRDFKPANVICDPTRGAVIMDFGLAQGLTAEAAVTALKAGTVKYMAPELLDGAPATIRSDIFAFGKVLGELLPGNSWAARCESKDPNDRPSTLAPVVGHLSGSTRRTVLRDLARGSIAAGSTLLLVKLSQRGRPQFTGRPALILNGFHAPDPSLASAMKRLVSTALNQSPILRLIPDETLTATLTQLKLPPALPAEWRHLRAAASRRSIPFMAEGMVSATGSGGLSLLVSLFERNSDRALLEVQESVDDRNLIVQLADKVVKKLRLGVGESNTSMASAYTDLVQATSASPEAVHLLYQGIDAYEHSRTDDALVLFEQALHNDNEFALAYAYAGLAALSRNSAEKAFPYLQRAMDLRSRVSQREQLWIERGYQNIIADYDALLGTCQKLTALYPDDPTFQKNLGAAYARIGRPQDGIEANTRALDLNPVSDSIKAELMVNLAAANMADKSLAHFQRFRAGGNHSSQFGFGASLAHLSAGQYPEGRAAFETMRATRKDDRQALLYRAAPLILMGKFQDAHWDLSGDLARDEATPDDEPYYRHVRVIWLACLDWFMDHPADARPRIDKVLKIEQVPIYLTIFREAGMVSLRTGYLKGAQAVLEILRKFEKAWPSAHSQGSRCHLEGALREAQHQDPSALLNQASGLWPDPLTLSSVRDYFMSRGMWDRAEAAASRIDEDRGRIFKHQFPGLFTLNQIAHIKIFAKLSRLDDSSRVYDQLMKHWDTGAEAFPMFRAIRGVAA